MIFVNLKFYKNTQFVLKFLMDFISLGWAGLMSSFTFFTCIGCLGTKWILIKLINFMGEILTTAVICFGMTLFGISIGFALFKNSSRIITVICTFNVQIIFYFKILGTMSNM